jgi:protein-tyrosine phosphatase
MDGLPAPLEIAEIEVGLGRIGISPCPGRGMRNSRSMTADRDLGADLRRIRDWGATTIISVIVPAELGWLQVPHLPGEVLRHRMDWLLVPVRDRDVPDDKAERAWANHGARIRGYVQQGQRILFHCRAGHGRSGMMAARLLIELGWDADLAISEVRRVRPGAIERASQEAAVRGWVEARSRRGFCSRTPQPL